MSEENVCPIWGTDCEYFGPPENDVRCVGSLRVGGDYKITGSALHVVGRLDSLEKVKLSRWIYEQNLLEVVPRIDCAVVEDVPNWPVPSVPERIDYLLQFVELETRGEIATPVPLSEKMCAAVVVSSSDKLWYLVGQASAMKLIEHGIVTEESVYRRHIKEITVKGYQRLEELKKTRPNSAQAFVAMWFDDTMNDAWEKGFEPAIIDAGYKPMRIDRKEHINKIDDEIIAEIRRSRFVVADFTSKPKEARGGVYYEAGFAHGLNIPVIYTCRKDRLDDVHFDTRQFNHLTWKTPEYLRKDLSRRISAVIGDGPHRKREVAGEA